MFVQNIHADDLELLVVHAGGGYENTTYLNSIEGFEQNYQKGGRLFEFDFNKTSDGVTVAFHNNKEKLMGVPKGFTYADWTNYEKYPSPHNVTRMDLPMVVELFKKYSDTYLMPDQRDNPDILQEIIDCFLSNDIPVDRLFIQLYTLTDNNNIKDYPIKYKKFTMYYIYNEYRKKFTPKGILAKIPYSKQIGNALVRYSLKRDMKKYFKDNLDVKILSMPINMYKEGYLNFLREEFDLRINVHTAKNMEEAQKLIELGVDGVTIDFL